MLYFTRIRPAIAAVGALFCLGVGATAQQLPPAPGQIPQVRRGADGRIEVVPPAPEPARPLNRQPAARSAPSATAPSATAPPAASPSATDPPAGTAPVGTAPVGTAPTRAVPQTPTPVTRKAEISVPEPLAVELLADEVSPSDSSLKALLDRAAGGGRKVTYELPQPLRLGPQRVTFTAWEGAPRTSAVAATRNTTLFILPHGMTPAGLSGDDHATAGNNATKIMRDSAGRVHMVWIDAGREGGGSRVLYRRATVTPDDTVHWETGAIRVDDAKSEAWNAYPGLAVSEDTVHVVWQAQGTARYRQVPLDGTAGEWGAIRDTGAISDGRDIGPAIAAEKGLIHIATPQAFDAVSRDAGATWKTEQIPLPKGQKAKSVSVALDHSGNAHFAISAVVHGPTLASKEKASNGYWELRYIRRNPTGAWSDASNALAAAPGWAEPRGDDDVLADWVRLAADDSDNLHLTWHGTAETRIYANDHAYYARRSASGGGWQSAWEAPISLLPANTVRNSSFSFAPSLALDRETAVAVPFYEVWDGKKFRGFDVVARVVANGKMVGEPIQIAQWVGRSIDAGTPDAGLSAEFPAAAPRLYHDPQGRLRLDLLETLSPQDGPKLIVYQRIDLTEHIKR